MMRVMKCQSLTLRMKIIILLILVDQLFKGKETALFLSSSYDRKIRWFSKSVLLFLIQYLPWWICYADCLTISFITFQIFPSVASWIFNCILITGRGREIFQYLFNREAFFVRGGLENFETKKICVMERVKS